MEGKGRGLEGKGAAGGVCVCPFGGVLMSSVGRGAVCVDPPGWGEEGQLPRKKVGSKGAIQQGWDAGEDSGTLQLWP